MEDKTESQYQIEQIVTNCRGFDPKMLSDAKMFPNARSEEDRLMASLYHLQFCMPVTIPQTPKHRFCYQLGRYVQADK